MDEQTLVFLELLVEANNDKQKELLEDGIWNLNDWIVKIFGNIYRDSWFMGLHLWEPTEASVSLDLYILYSLARIELGKLSQER